MIIVELLRSPRKPTVGQARHRDFCPSGVLSFGDLGRSIQEDQRIEACFSSLHSLSCMEYAPPHVTVEERLAPQQRPQQRWPLNKPRLGRRAVLQGCVTA